MKYLDQSLSFWGVFWRRATGRKALLRGDERISRFLRSDGHVRKATGEVKRQAFMPPPSLQLSVMHTDGLTESQVWKLGRRLLRQPFVGRADLKASFFDALALSVFRDDRPYRHANVAGWPPSVGEDKASQILVAQELSRIANETKGVFLK